MKISEIGERELLRRLFPIFKRDDPAIILNVGDDAAAVACPEELAVLTTDMLIEDVHFRREYFTAKALGRKCLAVNISDIAAIAGRPRYALVSLALPPDMEVWYIEDFYRGLCGIADDYGITIVGGDLASSPLLVISITLFGVAEKSRIAVRNAAEAGNGILVTGELGGSALGLEILQLEQPRIKENESCFIRCHLDPVPRVREALAATRSGVKVIEDISDGLLTEISHICEASEVGAEIRLTDIPLPRNMRTTAAKYGFDPMQFALSGGEDYELVMTAPIETIDKVMSEIENNTGTAVHFIGTITDEPGHIVLVDEAGNVTTPKDFGYEHFRK